MTKMKYCNYFLINSPGNALIAVSVVIEDSDSIEHIVKIYKSTSNVYRNMLGFIMLTIQMPENK